LSAKRRIGVAVSGGADSTALLVILSELRETLGFDLVALHVDHGLRRESASDRAFVEALAARLGVPCVARRFRIRRRKGESLEMAARRVRLGFFAEQTASLGLDAVATAHHADDLAETFLMRLARGSGPEGLAGLKPVSRLPGITFVRPFLGLTHADLIAFLERRGIAWREDATNADTSIPRNNVRHVVLPFLREHLDPHLVDHIAKTCAILRGDVKRASSGSLPSTFYPLPSSYRLTIAPAVGWERTDPFTAYFSRSALAGRTLEVRTWRAGDRIVPTGLGGHSRKLQDVFVTAKVPRAVRRTLPVLVDCDTQEVLWVPDYRVALSVAVPSSTALSWRFSLAKSGQ